MIRLWVDFAVVLFSFHFYSVILFDSLNILAVCRLLPAVNRVHAYESIRLLASFSFSFRRLDSTLDFTSKIHNFFFLLLRHRQIIFVLLPLYLFSFVAKHNQCTQRIKRTGFVILIRRFACTMPWAHVFLLSHFIQFLGT